MADIFNSQPGVVAVIDAEQAIPARIRISGFEPKAALISGIDYTQRTNQQFQYSLDKNVFIYVFGDLMGNLTVNGLAFPQLCKDKNGEGIVEVLAFYRTNRASVQPQPITIAIGNETIVGLLTELTLRSLSGGYDPTALTEAYSLTIHTLPRG